MDNNPHRLNMGQLSLRWTSSGAQTQAILLSQISNIHQTSDLYTGSVMSSYTLTDSSAGSYDIKVVTTMSPHIDAFALNVSWRAGQTPFPTQKHRTEDNNKSRGNGVENIPPLSFRLAFPYGSENFGPKASNWDADNLHTTDVITLVANSVLLHRQLDSDSYRVKCEWTSSSKLWQFTRIGNNAFELRPSNVTSSFNVSQRGDNYSSSSHMSMQASLSGYTELVCLFAPLDAIYPVGGSLEWLQSKRAATLSALSNNFPSFSSVMEDAVKGWALFWEQGSFVDLASKTSDSRAWELERRVILSMYLMAVQEAGAEPPQETGYICNSWAGKHHLEMRFWHHAHFLMWNRPELLARSDGYYSDLLENATSLAQSQGYSGARWLKETAAIANRSQDGIDVTWPGLRYAPFPFQNGSSAGYGKLLTWQAPGPQDSAIVWQQPHPIWLGDLQRQLANDTQGAEAAMAVVHRLSDIVFATADFMASYPYFNASTGTYWMGPPLWGAEEVGSGFQLFNPSFELVQFAYTLDVANRWRGYLGQPSNPKWDHVARLMSPPEIDIGSDPAAPTYSLNWNCACLFTGPHSPFCPGPIPDRPLNQCVAKSHPALVAFYGMINGLSVPNGNARPIVMDEGTHNGTSHVIYGKQRTMRDTPKTSGVYKVDPIIANRTLASVVSQWQWQDPSIWGWDFGLTALAQCRLGWQPTAIVDMLLMNVPKNEYLPNGHNYQERVLPAYMPGNGALLLAVAMMAAGSPTSPPSNFPSSWNVSVEGFATMYP